MRRTLQAVTFVLVFAALAAGASALSVDSPTNTTYDGLVPVAISAGANQSALAYTISDNTSVVANNSCENCSSLNDTVNLSSGDYELFASATGANASENQTVLFRVQAPVDNGTDNQTVLNLSINSPQSTVYHGLVPLNFSTNTPADISYALNDDNQSLACENCTSHTDEFNLTPGNYSLLVWAQASNQSVNQSVSFSVAGPNQTDNQTQELSLAVRSPVENASYQQLVPVNVTTTTAADISWALDGANATLACENCTSYTDTLNLSDGTYLFSAWAQAGNQSASSTVSFSVNTSTTDNQTQNQTNQTQPRFDLGFQKLPQQVASGNISDAQLAEILRNNELNPGVINRLVKTGELGNQSIDAIIEHQFTPPGILRKVAGFFGMHIPTPKERLAEEYNLSAQQQANLLSQEDVSEQGAQNIRERLERTGKPATPPGQAKKQGAQTRQPAKPVEAFNAGGQAREAPGQAKKADNRPPQVAVSGSSSPGNSAQAKERDAPGQARGQSDDGQQSQAQTRGQRNKPDKDNRATGNAAKQDRANNGNNGNNGQADANAGPGNSGNSGSPGSNGRGRGR